MFYQNKTYKINTDNPWQCMDQETIILSPKSNKAHELNKAGTYLWNHMQENNTPSLNELTELLSVKFNINGIEAKTDTELFLNFVVLPSRITFH